MRDYQEVEAVRHQHRTVGEAGQHHAGDVLIRWAGPYDAAMRLWGRGGRRWRSGLADRLGLRPGDRVLDVASGTGHLTVELARHVSPGGSVVGIDAAEEMVAQATRSNRLRGLPVVFQTARAQQLPFPDDSFTAATCTLALHHINPRDRLTAVEEIRRVLKPGGRLLIADFQPAPGQPARFLTGVLFGHAIAERPLDQAASLLETAGFTDLVRDGSSVGWIGIVTAIKASQVRSQEM